MTRRLKGEGSCFWITCALTHCYRCRFLFSAANSDRRPSDRNTGRYWASPRPKHIHVILLSINAASERSAVHFLIWSSLNIPLLWSHIHGVKPVLYGCIIISGDSMLSTFGNNRLSIGTQCWSSRGVILFSRPVNEWRKKFLVNGRSSSSLL